MLSVHLDDTEYRHKKRIFSPKFYSYFMCMSVACMCTMCIIGTQKECRIPWK